MGEKKGDATAETRLFVSKLTTNDKLHIAFQLRPDTPVELGHPWLAETVNWAEGFTTVVFEITPPGGAPTVLQAATKPAEEALTTLTRTTHHFTLSTDGLVEGAGTLAWKTKPAALFPEAGKYTVTLKGSLKTSKRTIEIASKPLSFEVVEPSDTFKTEEQLEAIAASVAKSSRSLPSLPKPTAATIDDVKDNRWYRFAADSGERSGYDIQVLELSLSPDGKTLATEVYKHFTCVAEGTSISTPGGSVLIESLVVGQQVLAYDVERGRRTTAVIEQISLHTAVDLFEFGALRVTGSHPIFTSRGWQDARDIQSSDELFGLDLRSRVTPMLHRKTASTVYDLTVSEPHTYFAGGFVVHNKARHNPIGGDDAPWQGWFYRNALAPKK